MRILYFLTILLFISSCSTGQNENKTANLLINKDSLLVEYRVRYNDTTKNIIITDLRLDSIIIWGKIENCAYKNAQFAEYIKPNLYVIKEFNTDSPNWHNELWVYSNLNDTGKCLLKRKGIEFSINKKQTLISYYNVDTLIILDLQNNLTRKIQISNDTSKLKEYYLESMKWSSDNDILWGVLSWCSASHYNFFSYNYKTDRLNKYEVPEGCNYDYDINPTKGLLLYSDYPFIVDAESAEDLVKSKTIFNLFVLDFKSNQKQKIESNIGVEFCPIWLTNDIFEFYSSLSKNKEKKRI